MAPRILNMPPGLLKHLRALVEKGEDDRIRRALDRRERCHEGSKLGDALMAMAKKYGHGAYKDTAKEPDYKKAAQSIRRTIKALKGKMDAEKDAVPFDSIPGDTAEPAEAPVADKSECDTDDDSDSECDTESDAAALEALKLEEQRTKLQRMKVVITTTPRAGDRKKCHWCHKSIAPGRRCAEVLRDKCAHKWCWDKETADAGPPCFARNTTFKADSTRAGKCDICMQLLTKPPPRGPSCPPPLVWSRVVPTKEVLCKECCVQLLSDP